MDRRNMNRKQRRKLKSKKKGTTFTVKANRNRTPALRVVRDK